MRKAESDRQVDQFRFFDLAVVNSWFAYTEDCKENSIKKHKDLLSFKLELAEVREIQLQKEFVQFLVMMKTNVPERSKDSYPAKLPFHEVR